MLVEDQPFDLGIGVEGGRRQLGETESRPAIGHKPEAAPVDLLRKLGTVRPIDQGQHGVGMRVIHASVRQEGMQQELHGGVRRQWVEEKGALRAHHVRIAQIVARAQPAHRRKFHRGKAARIDRGHVPA